MKFIYILVVESYKLFVFSVHQVLTTSADKLVHDLNSIAAFLSNGMAAWKTHKEYVWGLLQVKKNHCRDSPFHLNITLATQVHKTPMLL